MSDQGTPTKTISDFEAKLDLADKAVASFARDDRSLSQVARAFLRSNPTAIPATVLLISVLAFGLIAPRFLTLGTMSLVLQQVTVTGIVAIAQTLVILTAGIDLSVGAILVLSSLIMGNLAVHSGVPAPIAIVIGMFFGGLMGWINGVLVAYIKLPPFIVTLGTLSVFTALKLWYSHSESVRASDIEAQAPFLLWFGKGIPLAGATLTFGGIALVLNVTKNRQLTQIDSSRRFYSSYAKYTK